jgi:hypothetical protein
MNKRLRRRAPQGSVNAVRFPPKGRGVRRRHAIPFAPSTISPIALWVQYLVNVSARILPGRYQHCERPSRARKHCDCSGVGSWLYHASCQNTTNRRATLGIRSKQISTIVRQIRPISSSLVHRTHRVLHSMGSPRRTRNTDHAPTLTMREYIDDPRQPIGIYAELSSSSRLTDGSSLYPMRHASANRVPVCTSFRGLGGDHTKSLFDFLELARSK